MKKRILQIFLVFILLAPTISIKTSAVGGYAASRRSDVYHKIDCFYVDRIAEDNLVFYKTLEEAERSGKRGCMRCNPEYTGKDFRVGKTSRWTNSDPKIQSALEDEYKGGYSEGYEEGKEDGYDIGYEDGIKRGASDARSEFQKELEENTKDTVLGTLSVTFFIILPILSIVIESLPKKKSKAEKMRDAALAIKFEKDTVEPKQADNFSIHNSPIDHQKNKNQTQVNVDSNAFSFIDYQNTVLILMFRNGGEYHYYNVPKQVYEEFMAAPSKGRYYHEHIKDKYPYY